jgi:hypothetical protein
VASCLRDGGLKAKPAFATERIPDINIELSTAENDVPVANAQSGISFAACFCSAGFTGHRSVC